MTQVPPKAPVTLALIGLLIHPALAGLFVTPLDNASFETGTNPFGGAGNFAEVSSWFEENDAGGTGTADTREVAQDKLANTGNIPQDAVGQYWLNLAFSDSHPTPAVYQQIGTWEANLDLQITALLGDRSNQDFSGVAFEIWRGGTIGSAADGTTLASIGATMVATTGTLDPIVEGGSPVTASIDETVNTGVVGTGGEALWLRISTPTAVNGNQNLVDDVNITVIPEPSTLALMALTGIAAVLARRRRS